MQLSLNDAIEKALSGHCMLFLGAGFSIGAKNILDESLPSASELKAILEKETGMKSARLEYAADDYIDKFGENQLAPLLKSQFTVKELTRGQMDITSFEWKRVYTTNYDNVFEQGVRKTRKEIIETVTPSISSELCRDKSNCIVHINGSIADLTADSLLEEFKLTDRSYNYDSFMHSTWCTLLRHDIMDSDAIFFIGYSLTYDLDIKRVVSSMDVKDKIYFITASSEPEESVNHMARYGTVHKIGTDGFAKLLMECRKRNPNIIRLSRPLICFDHVTLPKARPALNDAMVNDFLLYGKVDRSALHFCCQKQVDLDYLYAIGHQESINRIFNQLDRGERTFVVHSYLGNGKSAFVQGLSTRLVAEGFDVYVYSHDRSTLQRELEDVFSRKSGRVVIILENYGRYKELLKLIRAFRSDQIVILTERTPVHELQGDEVINLLGEDYVDIDINSLSADDRSQLVRILEHYGLWGEIAKLTHGKKEWYIETDCNNSLRGILLKILNSPNIIDRFKGLIATMKGRERYHEVVILLMINSIADLNLDILMIEDALGNGANLSKKSFKTDENLRELIDIDNGEIRLQSALLADVLLRKVIDKEIIKNVLVKIFKNFDHQRENIDYKRVLQILLHNTTLKQIFDIWENGTGGYEVMTSFYEEVRDTLFCRNNPHYWLQYAILQLDRHDLDMARRYFETAYSYARGRKDFDTYQIDNHYARYLLEKGKELGKEDNYINFFIDAHKILIDKNHFKDTKYYPYKMAQLYEPFVIALLPYLTVEEKAIISRSCREILDNLNQYTKSIPDEQLNKAIPFCRKAMNSVVRMLE